MQMRSYLEQITWKNSRKRTSQRFSQRRKKPNAESVTRLELGQKPEDINRVPEYLFQHQELPYLGQPLYKPEHVLSCLSATHLLQASRQITSHLDCVLTKHCLQLLSTVLLGMA